MERVVRDYVVKVIPNAKIIRVEQSSNKIKVWVNSPAINGKANKAVLKLLADHLKVKSREISILKGEKSPMKMIRVDSVN